MLTETKSTVLLKHHLKALKLPTMHAECEKIAARAAQDNADHLAFLLQLCELELIERERKSAERRLKAARFPAHKLLDEFDFAARPSVNKPQMLELVKGEYLDRRENVLFVGPSGTGKSHLATALGMAACAQGRKVRFFRVTELITLLLEAKEERQLLRLRQQLGKLDLLILDELGYVPASKAGAELLFDVIASAYERNSLIVTTNLPFENWTEVLGQRTADGSGPGSAHAPLPHPGDQGRELPPAGRQTPPTPDGLIAPATCSHCNRDTTPSETFNHPAPPNSAAPRRHFEPPSTPRPRGLRTLI